MTMPDLSEDLRTYFDELASQIDRSSDSVGARRPMHRRVDRRLAVVVGVMAAVVLVGAVMVVISRRQRGVGVRTGPVATSTSTAPSRTRILYTHRSPDGSTVTARVGTVTIPAPLTCTTQDVTAPECGPRAGRSQTGPGIEFDYVIDGRHYRSFVLNSDSRLVPTPTSEPTSWGMVPLFASSDTVTAPGNNLIILHTTGPVAQVRLTPSGPGGASPNGDQMTPVDGWVTFPIHNYTRLANPEAFDANGNSLGTSMPFPCC
jgi:hypothetical protein